MKRLLLLLFTLAAFNQWLYGGLKSGYHSHVEIFTPTTLYYAVHEETGGFKSQTYGDLVIHDLASNTSKYVFEKKQERSIRSVIFELGYDQKEKKILYTDTRYRSLTVVNNHDIKEREPKNRMLIVVYRPNTGTNELWSCDLSGSDLKRIAYGFESGDVKLDVKNETIRIIKKNGLDLKVLNYEW